MTKNKFRNKKIGKYASKKESVHAGSLSFLEKIGQISDLREQVKYELIPKQAGERSVSYIADFSFIRNGELVVQDVKGMKTPVYVVKRKLMLWVHGIKIEEI